MQGLAYSMLVAKVLAASSGTGPVVPRNADLVYWGPPVRPWNSPIDRDLLLRPQTADAKIWAEPYRGGKSRGPHIFITNDLVGPPAWLAGAAAKPVFVASSGLDLGGCTGFKVPDDESTRLGREMAARWEAALAKMRARAAEGGGGPTGVR